MKILILYKAGLILLAYLLGSIPTSVWIGRYFYSIDVREHGSGNAGSTNTIRTLGMKPGIVVLAVDLLKGFLAVNLIRLTHIFIPGSQDFINFQLVLGAAAILGHIFPVYIGFKGGKGVATMFGMILAINTIPTLICVGIFLLVLFITKYVSLSSMVAGSAFPILLIFVFHTSFISLIVFSLVVAALLLITHQKNIERLIRKEESKATFLYLRNRKRTLR